MSDRRTDDATLISALRTLARTIQTDDGVIGACLAEAAARLETLVEERRWIPVDERLPELNEANRFHFNGLVSCSNGNVCEMTYEINTYAKHERHKQPRWKWHGAISIWEVTHWQPLPPGPEGDGKENCEQESDERDEMELPPVDLWLNELKQSIVDAEKTYRKLAMIVTHPGKCVIVMAGSKKEERYARIREQLRAWSILLDNLVVVFKKHAGMYPSDVDGIELPSEVYG